MLQNISQSASNFYQVSFEYSFNFIYLNKTSNSHGPICLLSFLFNFRPSLFDNFLSHCLQLCIKLSESFDENLSEAVLDLLF